MQCQSQLKTLYAEGIEGSDMEFAAYNLLCVIMHSNNNRDLVSSMARFALRFQALISFLKGLICLNFVMLSQIESGVGVISPKTCFDNYIVFHLSEFLCFCYYNLHC